MQKSFYNQFKPMSFIIFGIVYLLVTKGEVVSLVSLLIISILYLIYAIQKRKYLINQDEIIIRKWITGNSLIIKYTDITKVEKSRKKWYDEQLEIHLYTSDYKPITITPMRTNLFIKNLKILNPKLNIVEN